MVALRTSLRLRVVPGATRSRVVGRYGDTWKVRVSAQPEGGKANDAVLGLLADALAVTRGDLELLSGRSSRDKVVVLDGMTLDTAERRLAAAAESGRKAVRGSRSVNQFERLRSARYRPKADLKELWVLRR